MEQRIDKLEQRWAYYLGYGVTVTLLYLSISNLVIVACYNLYLIVLLSVPFVVKPSNVTYQPINLSIFSSIIGWLYVVARLGSVQLISFQSKSTSV